MPITIQALARGPLSALTAFAAAAAGLMAAYAGQTPLTPPAVPAAIAAPAEQTLTLAVGARGVQIYECRAPGDGQPPQWTFVAPEAELLDAAGRTVGEHGAGPFWRLGDGARITGRVSARADAPSPAAIPWLLLEARSDAPQPRLGGDVRSIQRIHTAGGTAPPTGCDVQTAGRQARVPYTADYLFYVR